MLAPSTPAVDAVLRERERRALQRAFARGLQAEVRQRGQRLFLVPSASRQGLLHAVAVTSRRGREHLICDCEAGLSGRPCTHTAAVYLFRLERKSGGTVIAVRPA